MSKLALLLAFAPYVLAQGDPQKSLQLDPKVLMKGLEQDGQSGPDVTAGQVRSLTSKNNFINFCLTQKVPLTDGAQVKPGSCNQTPMGRILATNKMPSSKFTNPENGSDNVKSFSKFTIKMAIKNLQTGNFVNPTTNYYAAPSQVNGDGILIGHSHVTVELIDDFKVKKPLDPNVFAFFKGLNLAAEQGILSADVDKGLATGNYRMCSINAAANHQPALVAVAQHGWLDDCVYFKISPAFTDALGGVTAPTVRAAGAKFKIDGDNKQFTTSAEAIFASCDVQRNKCADKANQVNGAGGVTIPACDAQKDKCLKQPGADAAAAGAANLNTFTGKLGADPIKIASSAAGQFVTDGVTLPNLQAAVVRACDTQRNKCADKGNAIGFKDGVTIKACDDQSKKCKEQKPAAAQTGNNGGNGGNKGDKKDDGKKDGGKKDGGKKDGGKKDGGKKDGGKKDDGKKDAPATKTVTVVKGDDCIKIAKAAGTTVDALLKANPSVNSKCTNLGIGQKLTIPGGGAKVAGANNNKDSKPAAKPATKGNGKNGKNGKNNAKDNGKNNAKDNGKNNAKNNAKNNGKNGTKAQPKPAQKKPTSKDNKKTKKTRMDDSA